MQNYIVLHSRICLTSTVFLKIFSATHISIVTVVHCFSLPASVEQYCSRVMDMYSC